jgi:putative ABC transport system permease protein
MIALPVAAVSIADTVYATADISGVEVVERRVGGGQAFVDAGYGAGSTVFQMPDPDDGVAVESRTRGGASRDAMTLEAVEEVLGPRPAITYAQGSVAYETELGVGDVEVLEADLTDPLAAGLVDLTDGRWPTSTDEVLVNADLLERGPGEALSLRDGTELRVVGTAESGSYTNYARAFALPGTFDLGEPSRWVVGGEPVTWDEVLALNRLGATVVSRAVLADPPPDSEARCIPAPPKSSRQRPADSWRQPAGRRPRRAGSCSPPVSCWVWSPRCWGWSWAWSSPGR